MNFNGRKHGHVAGVRLARCWSKLHEKSLQPCRKSGAWRLLIRFCSWRIDFVSRDRRAVLSNNSGSFIGASVNPLHKAAKETFDFLEKQSWQACLIGGLAAIHWGRPRATQDVDVSLFT